MQNISVSVIFVRSVWRTEKVLNISQCRFLTLFTVGVHQFIVNTATFFSRSPLENKCLEQTMTLFA